MAGTPDVVTGSMGRPGWGLRMYRQASREPDTSRKPSVEEDFLISASTSPCRTVLSGLTKPEEGLTHTKYGPSSGVFARSPSPRTAVAQRLDFHSKVRLSQGVDKPRGLSVSAVANTPVENKPVKAHRRSRIPKLSSSPALSHAGISPTIHPSALPSITEGTVNANRSEIVRANGVHPSRSLTMVGTTSALPPVPPGLVKGNPSDLANYRLGRKNTSVKADLAGPSTLSSDAKWRASMSRVAHRIQASLGRGGDSKQRLHRLFHSSNGKLMRKSTTDRRPRLDLFFTTSEVVHDTDDFDNDDTVRNPTHEKAPTRNTTDEVHSDLGESDSMSKVAVTRSQNAAKRHSETDATVAHQALEAIAKEATSELASSVRVSPLSTMSKVLTSALPSRPRRTTMAMLPAKQPSVATGNIPNKRAGDGTTSLSRRVGESISTREEPRGQRSKSVAPLPIPVRTSSRNYRSLGSRQGTPPIAQHLQQTKVPGTRYLSGQHFPSKGGMATNALRGRPSTRRPPSRHSPGLGASSRRGSPGLYPKTGRSPDHHGADASRPSAAAGRSSAGLSEQEGSRRNSQEIEHGKSTKRMGKLPQLPTPSPSQAAPRTYFGKGSQIRKALGKKNNKSDKKLGKTYGTSHANRRVEKTREGNTKDATDEIEQSTLSFDEESANDPEQLLAALLSGDIFGLGEHFTTPGETWSEWSEHPSEEPSAAEENFHQDMLAREDKSRRRLAQPSAVHHLPDRITYIAPDLHLDPGDSIETHHSTIPMPSDVPGALPAIQPGSVGNEGETAAVPDHADTGLSSTKINRIPGIYDTTTDIEEGASTIDQSPAVATPQEPSTGGHSALPPPEPASILKAISNYLVPALTELLLPLDYPFSPSVHILPDSAVVIRDEEPTSIIAYTLSSRDFRMQFSSVAHPNLSPQRVDLWDPYGAPMSPRRNLRITTTTTTTTGPTSSTQTTTPMTTGVPGELAGPQNPVYMENEKVPVATGRSETHSSPIPTLDDRVIPPSTTTVTPTDDSKRSPRAPSHRPSRHNSAPTSPALGPLAPEHTWQDLEQVLRASTSNHVRYEFSHGPTNFICKIFFAEQFDALRRSCECELAYIESLSRCAKWHASGGKSGSGFLKTADNRFIVKELSKPELDSFLQFAPYYFEYLAEAIFHELPTVLAKIYGLYQISFKNPVTGKSLKLDVMIMENLFYERQFTKTFDLKGSTRNRLVADTGKAGEVLLDENFIQYLTQTPLYVREHSKELIQSSIWNDTLFLANHDVVDYSLLVAIDEEKHDLVVGIVDFIQTFTWDKRLENWVKETGFLGGGGKQPTIISPKQYKQRFRNAMGRYFTVVPDKFFNTAIPLHEDDDSTDEETPRPAETSSP
ncbi:Mitochondrial distribution and morphology protein 12 [Dispira parvispora]|uniref:Mitochondrial distribution and morphology protein 12 n=1 Tax=Dispira parvispora TaxID=1520584 RepID=A0A9W8E9T4_9FUNG|nr:Mitochondrial distribution and morphology protein 12 [Dispira parvispora]